MGLFSMYTGLMYNDVFSKAVPIWRSGWDWVGEGDTLEGVSNGHIYPFGMDPAWREADNSLVFTNSYKMKMSIVLGVLHVRARFFLSFRNSSSRGAARRGIRREVGPGPPKRGRATPVHRPLRVATLYLLCPVHVLRLDSSDVSAGGRR